MMGRIRLTRLILISFFSLLVIQILIVGIFGSLLFIMLLLYRLKHGRKAIHFTRRGENKTCIMEGGTSL